MLLYYNKIYIYLYIYVLNIKQTNLIIKIIISVFKKLKFHNLHQNIFQLRPIPAFQLNLFRNNIDSKLYLPYKPYVNQGSRGKWVSFLKLYWSQTVWSRIMKFYMEKQFFISFKLVFFGFLIRALLLELYRFTLVHLRWNKLYLHVLFCCFFIKQFVELQKAKDICDKVSGINKIFSHMLRYSISHCRLVCWTVIWSVHWSCICIFGIPGQFSRHCPATCNW